MLDVSDCKFDEEKKQILLSDLDKVRFLKQYIQAPKSVVIINKSDLLSDKSIKNLDFEGYNLVFDELQIPIFDVISCKNEASMNRIVNKLSQKVFLIFEIEDNITILAHKYYKL